jgi:hypothetical protein
MVICALLIGPVAAKEATVCEAPAVSSKLVSDGSIHMLVLTVSNQSAKELSLEQYHFGENMLGLHAVKTEGNVELKHGIPLLSPGVTPVTIPPGKAFVRRISLESSFADLPNALTASDVLVSWELTMDGKGACFVQKLSGAFKIPKSG